MIQQKVYSICHIRTTETRGWTFTLYVNDFFSSLFDLVKDKEKEKLLSRNQELKLQELKLQKKVNELHNAIMVS